jgi:hypothetical protein
MSNGLSGLLKTVKTGRAVAEPKVVEITSARTGLTLREFYARVLPATGNYCLFRSGSKRHIWASSIDELVQLTEAQSDASDVYFAVAALYDQDSRTQVNVTSKHAFYLDLDAGEAKLAKHGPEKTYETQRHALEGVQGFIKSTGLVPTLIVSSGEGLHLYWELSEDVPGVLWTPVAKAFQKFGVAAGLKIDSSVTADSARVLRPVGTRHPNGKTVTVIMDTGRVYRLDEFAKAVGYMRTKPGLVEVNDDWADGAHFDSGVADINDDLALHESQPKSMARILTECGAASYANSNQDRIEEPYWRAMIGLAKHTTEGREAAHDLSRRHPEYDAALTEEKFDRWATGPTTCERFEEFNPKACGQCKHKGKFKSPIVLGAEPSADGSIAPSKPLPPVITEINADTFVAPDGAGQPYIWREREDPETGLAGLVAMSQQGFRLLYANRFVKVKKNIDGDTEESTVNAANYWVQHTGRRQFPKGVALLPEGPTPKGVYNLWRGFPIEPAPGDVSLMLDHVLMMCGGDVKVYTYLLNWLALCVQHPGTQPEVAVVALGGRGTGKGTLFRLMLHVFGCHGLHITNGKMLTGDFNAHLRGALFVFVDEGYWAGDKAGEGVLKGLITEPTIVINGKNKDVFVAPNRLKIAFASNDDWVVPAGSDERRYLVVDVPPTRRGDKAYFRALYAWSKNGGDRAWLHHLQTLDISGFDSRSVPSTAALDRQKLASMSTFDRWILDCLEQGVEPTPNSIAWSEDGAVLATRYAVVAYAEFAKTSGGRWAKPMSVYELGDGLKRLFDTGRAVTARVTNPPSKAWKLPGLTEARDRAASAMGLAHHVWGDA